MEELLDMLIIKSNEEKLKQQQDERPFLHLEIDNDFYYREEKKEKEEPKRVIIIEL
tara:strand:- start:34943 stop:35110 length:168 start_codon:yes stop_codon:yes gene_type:complete